MCNYKAGSVLAMRTLTGTVLMRVVAVCRGGIITRSAQGAESFRAINTRLPIGQAAFGMRLATPEEVARFPR